LKKFKGTLIFISHDREFVSSLATRILEMKPDGINDFKGNYDDYLNHKELNNCACCNHPEQFEPYKETRK